MSGATQAAASGAAQAAAPSADRDATRAGTSAAASAAAGSAAGLVEAPGAPYPITARGLYEAAWAAARNLLRPYRRQRVGVMGYGDCFAFAVLVAHGGNNWHMRNWEKDLRYWMDWAHDWRRRAAAKMTAYFAAPGHEQLAARLDEAIQRANIELDDQWRSENPYKSLTEFTACIRGPRWFFTEWAIRLIAAVVLRRRVRIINVLVGAGTASESPCLPEAEVCTTYGWGSEEFEREPLTVLCEFASTPHFWGTQPLAVDTVMPSVATGSIASQELPAVVGVGPVTSQQLPLVRHPRKACMPQY